MFNRVVLMGRLTADPELRTTTNGVATCAFRLAVDRKYKSQNGERQADFINVVTWRQTAEFVCRYFSKGRSVLVEGTLQSRTYDDKDGKKVYVTEVVADAVYFTGERTDNPAATSSTFPEPPPAPDVQYSSGAEYASYQQMDLSDEDFPF